MYSVPHTHRQYGGDGGVAMIVPSPSTNVQYNQKLDCLAIFAIQNCSIFSHCTTVVIHRNLSVLPLGAGEREMRNYVILGHSRHMKILLWNKNMHIYVLTPILLHRRRIALPAKEVQGSGGLSPLWVKTHQPVERQYNI